ncbi:hypothetical protein EHS25_003352 [Saitozyma podzolica]|uniref:Uncharacterized protein n=1 Tax=Saitozyma podzolica TaxID=1890683 RepID=A0A427Y8J1_9TREE|nr:hypothetical protein EHS25_003352 [Saitozyma podzolica]
MSSNEGTQDSQVLIDWQLVEGRTIWSTPSLEETWPDFWTWDYDTASKLVDENDSSKSLFRYVPASDNRAATLVLTSGGLDELLDLMRDTATEVLSQQPTMELSEIRDGADELNTCYVHHQLTITPAETLQALSGKSLNRVLAHGDNIMSLSSVAATTEAFLEKLREQSGLGSQQPQQVEQPVLPPGWGAA